MILPPAAPASDDDDDNAAPAPLKKTRREEQQESGERWFLVDFAWFQKAQAHRGDPQAHPRPPALDNTRLIQPLTGDQQLRSNLVRNIDYEIVGESEYRELEQRYGPARPRALETRRTALGKFCIYPISIAVSLVMESGDLTFDHHAAFFPETTLQQIYDELCKPQRARMWVKLDPYAEFRLCDMAKEALRTLADMQWQSQKTQVLVEPPPFAKSRGGGGGDIPATSKPSPLPMLRLVSNPKQLKQTVNAIKPLLAAAKPQLPRGVRGMVNLGNTCYLNVVLQTLVHTQKLAAMFLGGSASKRINASNALGQRGDVVRELGLVFREMWGSVSPFALPYSPSKFKQALDKWTFLFREFKQQDAQEALAYVLDALHEDTRGDEGASSVVTDVFGGELAFTLTCPNCAHASTTTEKFSMLSLEIPVITPVPVCAPAAHVDIIFFPLDPALPARRVQVPMTDRRTVSCEAVARAAGVDATVLAFVRREGALDFRIDIRPDAATVLPQGHKYEMVAYEQRRQDGNVLFHVVHRIHKSKMVGAPMVISAEAKTTRELVDLVIAACPPGSESRKRVLSHAHMGIKVDYDQLSELVPKDDVGVKFPPGWVVIVDWIDADGLVFRDLPPPAAAVSAISVPPPPTTTQALSLEACLNHFFAPETLTSDNMWDCPNCHSKQLATRVTKCLATPTNLILHLKRFRADGTKIRDLVAFNETITLPGKPEITYALQSVIRHHGPEASRGHYTACVKSNVDAQWRTLNDESVSAPLTRGAPLNEPDAFIFVFRQVKPTSQAPE